MMKWVSESSSCPCPLAKNVAGNGNPLLLAQLVGSDKFNQIAGSGNIIEQKRQLYSNV